MEVARRRHRSGNRIKIVMKYVRKITALVLAIIFCAAIVIGVTIIYSVKNVNVEYIDYSGTHLTEYAQTKQNFEKLKGSNMLFLKDGKLEEYLSDSKVISVAKYEKVYPCTVNVVLKERVECYVAVAEGGFAVYDEDGLLMHNVAAEDSEAPLNSADLCPNVRVQSDGGQLSVEDFKSVARVGAFFKEEYGSLRKLVENITVYGSINTIRINLRTGITVALNDWQTAPEEKVKKSYEVYSSLTDAQRVCGMITVMGGVGDAGPSAKYQ